MADKTPPKNGTTIDPKGHNDRSADEVKKPRITALRADKKKSDLGEMKPSVYGVRSGDGGDSDSPKKGKQKGSFSSVKDKMDTDKSLKRIEDKRIKKEVKQTLRQFEMTKKMFELNQDIFKENEDLNNLLKKFMESGLEEATKKALDGQELLTDSERKNIEKLLNDQGVILEALESSEELLKLNGQNLADLYKKILLDSKTSEKDRQETLKEYHHLLATQGASKEVLKELLGAIKNPPQGADQLKTLEKIMDNTAAGTKEIQINANLNDLNRRMDSLVLTSQEADRTKSVVLGEKKEKPHGSIVKGSLETLGAAFGLGGVGDLFEMGKDLKDVFKFFRGGEGVSKLGGAGKIASKISGGAGKIASKLGGAGKVVTNLASKAGGVVSKIGGGALSSLGKGAKFLGNKIPFIGGALSFANALNDGNSVGKAASRATGSIGGAAAGGATGALLGSVVPVIGTAIGGVIGSFLGGWLGDYLGDVFSDTGIYKKISNGVSKMVGHLTEATKKTITNIFEFLSPSNLMKFVSTGVSTASGAISDKVASGVSTVKDFFGLNKKRSTDTGEMATDALKRFEGFSPTSYDDSVGNATTGYGHLSKKGDIAKFDKDGDGKLSEAEATAQLQDDMVKHQTFKKKLKVKSTPEQDAALTSLAFNIGADSKGVNNVVDLMNSGDMVGAKAEFLKYNKAKDSKTGKYVELAGLNERRQAEANLFSGGLVPASVQDQPTSLDTSASKLASQQSSDDRKTKNNSPVVIPVMGASASQKSSTPIGRSSIGSPELLLMNSIALEG